jgi:hypothetical protein
MISILIVEKNGVIKESCIKTFNIDDLFKKACFKSSENFKLQHIFDISLNDTISLYGKTKGKANQENKYEFPPPIDNILFYGKCILIKNKKENNKVQSLTCDEWEKIYEKMMGGFDDLDSDEESSVDIIDPLLLTKDGYLKDNFVTDIISDEDDYDNDDNEDNDEDDDVSENNSENDDYVVDKKKKTSMVKNNNNNNKIEKKKKMIKKNVEENDNEIYLDCSSELIAEEYLIERS